ncbi:MAG: cytochrome c oxidase accessory protein CcoG [Rhodocyclaceae bacterium]|nr:cytochrome c oxidase accessory protein CcoG [Rhodocyclaceae bacterium]
MPEHPAAGRKERKMSRIRQAKIELYRRKGKIHPRAVGGRFDTLRWVAVWFTQVVFYGACWLDWNGRQAILFDIPNERFHVLAWTFWPQDALLLALALIFAATLLFFVTALAGRLFCGFACPQTVYTSIFVWIEARVEGDHVARLRLDAAPHGPKKLLLRAAKHALWLLVALWTGITFVGYFSPVDELLARLAAGAPGPWEGFWTFFYALFTYVQAGFAREAVCQHMCPYSRFQGVMFDAATKSVAYDARRGEPRGARRETGVRGDCVDCGLCVEVCPTGIDIRDGLQYQCINCGLCADACDQVMTRIGAPTGLIRFAAERELAGEAPPPGRPRVAVYGAALVAVAAYGGWLLAERSPLLVDVLRDRGALLRETGDGIENAYTLRLSNRGAADDAFAISASGPPGLRVVGDDVVRAEAGSVRSVPLTLAVPEGTPGAGMQPIRIDVRSLRDPAVRRSERSSFALPAQRSSADQSPAAGAAPPV